MATYRMPADGWVCYHCGERFKTPGGARDHFGATPVETAACIIKAGEERGLVMALRRAEEEIMRLRAQLKGRREKEAQASEESTGQEMQT